MKLWALLVLALVWTGSAQASPFATLRWTNPCFNAALDESGRAYCELSPDSCHDLGKIEIWGQPSWGGGWKKILELNGLAKECLPDSAQVDRQYNWASWHYYILTWDLSGNPSPCPSNVVFVQGSQVTGVPIGPVDEVLRTAYFDVRGRLVKKPQASGIYWLRTWYKSGRVETKRVVILH